jgi:predicted dehydrogenase
MTAMATRLQIVVVGAGAIGRAHIDLISQSAECSLAAIVDPAARAGDLAQGLGVPHYHGLDTLLADRKPDGAIIASPNHLHTEQGLAFIAAGIPCLIEKPVAHDVASGERICAAAETSGVPILIGHHRLHSPIIAEARKVIASGALGTIVAVMGSALFYKPDGYFDEGPWRREPGGGPILINMIHEVARSAARSPRCKRLHRMRRASMPSRTRRPSRCASQMARLVRSSCPTPPPRR